VRLGWSTNCADSEWAAETNLVEALNCDRKTLKEKWSFSRVIWKKRKTMAQRRKKLTTGLVYWSKRFKSKWKEMIFLNISPTSVKQPLRLLILRGKRCCTDTKQQQCRLLLRPRWHSVRPATVFVRGHPGVYHLPCDGFVVPWWKGNRPSTLQATRSRSINGGAVIDQGCVGKKMHVFPENQPMHRICTGI